MRDALERRPDYPTNEPADDGLELSQAYSRETQTIRFPK
jgi:hypothetical protein